MTAGDGQNCVAWGASRKKNLRSSLPGRALPNPACNNRRRLELRVGQVRQAHGRDLNKLAPSMTWARTWIVFNCQRKSQVFQWGLLDSPSARHAKSLILFATPSTSAGDGLNTETAMPVAADPFRGSASMLKAARRLPPVRPTSAHPPSINVFRMALRSYPRRAPSTTPMTQREAPFLDLALGCGLKRASRSPINNT
jgi:hypothetical protein